MGEDDWLDEDEVFVVAAAAAATADELLLLEAGLCILDSSSCDFLFLLYENLLAVLVLDSSDLSPQVNPVEIIDVSR